MLRRVVDLRTGEHRNTLAAFGALLALTSGHTLLETARDALFLARVPASRLPWVYLIVVALALTISRIRSMDRRGAIVVALLGGAGVTAGFWFLTSERGDSRVLFALYVWSALFVSWVTTQFWTMLSRVHTMTQAKRLYGFIGAGAVLGGVLGAFAARAALAFIPPRAILLTSSALFVVAAVPVVVMRAPPRSPSDPAATATESARPMSTGASLLWKTVFARRVFAIVLVATIAVTLADFVFKARLAATYTDSRDLAARLSTFYAVTNSVALVAQIVVGPWVFRTIGVQRALFLFPSLLLGAAGALVASGGGLLSAVVLKGFDASLRYSIHKTSVELLLVPVPDGTRERVKPVIELLGTRGGQAVASVLILVLVALGASGVAVVGAVVMTLLVLWLANVVTIRRHYLDVFRDTLRSGGMSGAAELPELDLGALELLFAALNSSRDAEVLAALDLLAEQNREGLIPALILYHPSRAVVLRAIELFSKQKRTDFVAIADRLNEHPDRDVAAAALRARSAVAADRALLERRLAGDSPHVAATALVSLLTRGWIDDDDAGRRLRSAVESRSLETVVALARAIRDLPSDLDVSAPARARLDDLLVLLDREASTFRPTESADAPADDLRPDVRVRLEVARALATTNNPAFLPVLVGLLNRHELRATARAAIQHIPGALDFIDDAMLRRDYARDVRVHLPRTMALLDPDAAARKLMASLRTELDGAVRYKVLRALVRLRRANPQLLLESDLLARVTASTLDHAEELQRWGVGLARSGDEPAPSLDGPDLLRAGHHLLVDLVRDKARHARQRLFMLLELTHHEDFDDIERGLRSANPKTRANSLELLENVVAPSHRARVLALVGEPTPADETLTYERVLFEMHAKGGRTTRALADYRAAELGLDLASSGAPPSTTQALASLTARSSESSRSGGEPDFMKQGARRASA
ncbi:MAG: hypothetical protein KF850_40720 [Labilithrix sp.]|nr:hypothetical protein [Labilithrix sp.]